MPGSSRATQRPRRTRYESESDRASADQLSRGIPFTLRVIRVNLKYCAGLPADVPSEVQLTPCSCARSYPTAKISSTSSRDGGLRSRGVGLRSLGLRARRCGGSVPRDRGRRTVPEHEHTNYQRDDPAGIYLTQREGRYRYDRDGCERHDARNLEPWEPTRIFHAVTLPGSIGMRSAACNVFQQSGDVVANCAASSPPKCRLVVKFSPELPHPQDASAKTKYREIGHSVNLMKVQHHRMTGVAARVLSVAINVMRALSAPTLSASVMPVLSAPGASAVGSSPMVVIPSSGCSSAVSRRTAGDQSATRPIGHATCRPRDGAVTRPTCGGPAWALPRSPGPRRGTGRRRGSRPRCGTAGRA